jgi:CRISPR-associated endonuclease Csn1
MKKILGLDLGTTSIGWALVNEASRPEEKSEIIKLGVRVVPLTTDEKGNFETGKAITTNQDRRMARSMRRNLQRYKLRRNQLFGDLLKAGIISKEFKNTETEKNTTHIAIALRAKAAREPVTLEELARVFFMINKKRGYKSNRKADNQDEEVGTAINEMDLAMELLETGKTPGEYLFNRALAGKKSKPQFYKSDLVNELDRIWTFQRQFYPEMLTDELKRRIIGLAKKGTSDEFRRRFKIDTADVSKEDRNIKPYQWRANGLTIQLDPEELAYVVSDLNGEISSSSGYLAEISDRSKNLLVNDKTIGEYLWEQIQADPDTRVKGQTFYRKDYENEFDRIWETQTKHHLQLTNDLKKRIKDNIIFYQRPLKSQKGRLAICELEGRPKEMVVDGVLKKKQIGPRVCPKSSPIFQMFKILQTINNLEIKSKEDEQEKVAITLEDQEKLFLELFWNRELKANQIIDLVLGKGASKIYKLNYEALDGNEAMAAIFKAFTDGLKVQGYDLNWSRMAIKEKLETLGKLFEDQGINQKLAHIAFEDLINDPQKHPIYQLWHLLYSYEGDLSESGEDSLIKILTERFGFSTQSAKILARVTFKQDYGSLSTKAMRKILPHMMAGHEYSKAAEKAGYNHSKSRTSEDNEKRVLVDKLEILPKNSLRNPVVEKILNQMIHVVNKIGEVYGKPDEIRLEMARELKMSAKERATMTKNINDAKRQHDAIREILRKEFGLTHISRNDIIRYKLYEELKNNGYKGLYSNKYIPREKLFSKDIDIEHIIPKSVLFDDSFANKTLEYREVNIEKGDLTAYDYVAEKKSSDLDAYKSRVNSMRGFISPGKIKKLLMPFDQIPENFIDRDLRNTQYIAKKAREILDEAFRTVNTTTGTITNRLREDWQLVEVLKELNLEKYRNLGMVSSFKNKEGNTFERIEDWSKRNDHRHHAMDALAVAFTRYEHVQYLNNLNARKDENHKESGSIKGIEAKYLETDKRGKKRFKPPMPLLQLRVEAKNHLEAILVSFKAKNKVVTPGKNKILTKYGFKIQHIDTPRGQLHKETVYGVAKQYVTTLVKVDAKMDAERIGTVAKKKIREALLERLHQFDGDPKKAFTGKNAPNKNPIWINETRGWKVPDKVKLVNLEPTFTIKKAIGPDLKIDKVIDGNIQKILKQHLDACGGNEKQAFGDLKTSPIILPGKNQQQIKSVKISGISNGTPLRHAKDHLGNFLLDPQGQKIPTDYINTGSNHHVAIYLDNEGNYHEKVVSFYEAVWRAKENLPVVDKTHNQELGWTFLFTLKQNEYFAFPNPEKGFDPDATDLFDPANAALISPNLFRVQKIANKDYTFRHHLETELLDNKILKGIAYLRVTNIKVLANFKKVRINHIGQVVEFIE